jgi:RNA 2',3'-cyclic 3'-phosphodiesterase
MSRLFFALWPDDGTRTALAEAAARLEIRDGRAVRPENLHLTLHFLGEVDAAVEGELRRRGKRSKVAPFELEIAASGWWRGARVAWLAPLATPGELADLVVELASSLRSIGLETEDRPYRPHVTVARKVRRTPRVSGAIDVHWRVEDYVLAASRTDPAGARYEVLDRWPLGA